MHDNGGNSYLLVNGKKIDKIKENNNIVNFPSQFCIGSIFNNFEYDEAEEASLKENVYDFSVDYDAIDKSDMLNIHSYLMVRNNINYY